MKTCKKCGAPRPIVEFPTRKASKDGKHSWCKSCLSNYMGVWYKKNRAVRLRKHTEWNANNKGKLLCIQKRHRGKYPERHVEHKRMWRETTKEAWMLAIIEKFGDWSCTQCGYRKTFKAIDFHHVDPLKKEGSLSYMIINLKPTSKRLKELDQVVPLCKNCHVEAHEEMVNGDSKS